MTIKVSYKGWRSKIQLHDEIRYGKHNDIYHVIDILTESGLIESEDSVLVAENVLGQQIELYVKEAK